jgi:hypothetical protein
VHAFAVLLLIVLAPRGYASESGDFGMPVAATKPHPLTIDLSCEGTTSPLRELHGWDPRVPTTSKG